MFNFNDWLIRVIEFYRGVVTYFSSLNIEKLSQKDRFELYELLAIYVSDRSDPEILFNKKRRTDQGRKNRIYKKVKLRMSEGISLSEALKPFIPSDEYIFLEAANGQRDFAVMLEELIRVSEAKNDVISTFRKGALMPIVIYIVSIMITSVAVYFLAPSILEMVGNQHDDLKMKWVPATLIPMASMYLPVISFLIPFLFLLIVLTMPHFSHTGSRVYLDRVFPWNTYKDMNSSIMLLISASAIKGGLTLEHIFKLQASISPKYMASWLELIRDRLSSGEFSDPEAMDVGIINDDDMDLIDDYSVSREFSAAIVKIGARALNNAKERMKYKFFRFTFLFAMMLLTAALYLIGSIVGYLILNVEF